MGWIQRAVLERLVSLLAESGFPEVRLAHANLLTSIPPDTGARMGELATRLRITRGAVTQLVADLEEAGILRRERHPSDGRGVIVRPTERALRGYAIAREWTVELYDSWRQLAGVAGQIAANLGTIFHDLRAVAGYQGPIAVLTYYSLSYSDPVAIAGTQFLDSVIAGVTTASGGIVADGFAAFQGPSLAHGGDPCAAGLLIPLPDGTCNIHPSAAGHQLLAAAIAAAIGA